MNQLELIPTARKPLIMPVEQNWKAIQLHADRYWRASEAMRPWSEKARKCVDYVEGKQWGEADLLKLEAEGRPALVINKIRPLVKLVVGYHLTNQTDTKYLPGHDGTGTAATAEAISHIGKQISERNQEPYVDTEVFMDGMMGGRGYHDTRIDFQENDLGEVRTKAADPFSVYLDPDADEYDINTGSFVMTTRWVSLEEIEYYYGKYYASMIAPWYNGGRNQGMANDIIPVVDEITPFRNFGGDEESGEHYHTYANSNWDFVDVARKNVRMLDIQHYVRVHQYQFVDMKSGAREPVPDHWSREKVQAVLDYARAEGDEIQIDRRNVRRLRNTQMIGDVLVYDQWAPWKTFTYTPFFPYFRRGRTRGMVEDLLDPQDEINTRHSARINMIGKTSNGGWMYEEGSLNPIQESNLEQNGSAPGFKLKYSTKNGVYNKPEQITPGVPPVAMQQLEMEAKEDLPRIAGINESALGNMEAANASGRSLENRQRQAVMGLEGDMANFRRSKELVGRKKLELIQGFYTEERIIRVIGSQQAEPSVMAINQRTAAGIINAIALGKYEVSIDETPITANFLEAQFEEMMRLKEMGVPIPDEWIIRASSFGRKDELVQQMKAVREAQSAEQAAINEGMPPVGGEGQTLGPAGVEPGKPPVELAA